jgi:hypothetical protein
MALPGLFVVGGQAFQTLIVGVNACAKWTGGSTMVFLSLKVISSKLNLYIPALIFYVLVLGGLITKETSQSMDVPYRLPLLETYMSF